MTTFVLQVRLASYNRHKEVFLESMQRSVTQHYANRL